MYFRGCGKWVSARFDVPWRGGWTRIEVDKKSFKLQGKDFDWAKVDAVQLSGRRNGTKDTAIRIRNLQALPQLTPPPAKPTVEENLAWLAAQPGAPRGELRGCYCHRATEPYPKGRASSGTTRSYFQMEIARTTSEKRFFAAVASCSVPMTMRMAQASNWA